MACNDSEFYRLAQKSYGMVGCDGCECECVEEKKTKGEEEHAVGCLRVFHLCVNENYGKFKSMATTTLKLK